MGRGISFREECRRFYLRGYTIDGIAQILKVDRELVESFLEAAGFKNPQEQFPDYVPFKPITRAPSTRPRPDLRQPVVASVCEPPRAWCSQCECLVTQAQGESCDSRWCKAKAEAA